MTEQSDKRRYGAQEQVPQSFVAFGGKNHLLTQQNQLFTQLVFHLDAMKMHRNLQPLEYVFTEKQAVMPLHIEQLDRKDVGATVQFGARHHQRRRLFLLIPPFDSGRKGPQGGKRDIAQNTE